MSMLDKLVQISEAVKADREANPELHILLDVIRDEVAWSLDAEPLLRRVADAILAAGYRKIFDGDCGLSNVKDPSDKEAAEAWMRWANLVNTDGGEPNGIAAMKQMLTEFGYSRPAP